jgi:hypothetical protein
MMRSLQPLARFRVVPRLQARRRSRRLASPMRYDDVTDFREFDEALARCERWDKAVCLSYSILVRILGKLIVPVSRFILHWHVRLEPAKLRARVELLGT